MIPTLTSAPRSRPGRMGLMSDGSGVSEILRSAQSTYERSSRRRPGISIAIQVARPGHTRRGYAQAPEVTASWATEVTFPTCLLADSLMASPPCERRDWRCRVDPACAMLVEVQVFKVIEEGRGEEGKLPMR